MARSRVDEVRRLLGRLWNKKMVCETPDGAIEIARRALSMAPPTGIWRPLCRYRLAHLLMRLPDPPLREIEGHLRDAASQPALGPLPPLFHLAVLSRLEAPESPVLEQAYAAARDAVLNPVPESERVNTKSQSSLFNLFDLSTWFMGRSAQSLAGRSTRDTLTVEGRRNAFDDLRVHSGFVLLTNIETREWVLYPERAAEAEGRSLLEGPGPRLFLRLSRDAAPQYWADGRWKSYGSERQPRHEEAGLLALALHGDAFESDAVRLVLELDDLAPANTVLQRVRRLGQHLCARAGADASTKVFDHEGTRWTLTGNVGLVCMIESGLLAQLKHA